MIDPSILLTLKTKNELRAVSVLLASAEPMRQKDIVESLQTTRERCKKALESLIEKRLVRVSIKFGVTLYEVSEEFVAIATVVSTTVAIVRLAVIFYKNILCKLTI